MASKRIRISPDNGSNWYTFPGSGGSMSSEAGQIDDTILGQNFASTQTGLIGYSVDTNGLYKGFAGYVAELKKAGTSTALTDEPMSLVSGKTYQVTDAAKRMFDRTVALTFEDNGVAVSSNDIESIDHLFGRVTFTSGYTPTTPITVASGNYIPLVTIGRANAFTLTQTAEEIMDADFDTVQGNSGHNTYLYGLKTVELELTGIYASSNAWRTALIARSELMVEINPDGNGKSVARGFFKFTAEGQEGDVGALEEETATLSLSVPDQANVVVPFKWLHASDTTLSLAIRSALSAWENETEVDIQYLPDGTNGVEGEAIITNVSLSSGLEVMNDFAITARISGQLTAVP